MIDFQTSFIVCYHIINITTFYIFHPSEFMKKIDTYIRQKIKILAIFHKLGSFEFKFWKNLDETAFHTLHTIILWRTAV